MFDGLKTNMEIRAIYDKNEWENFLWQCDEKTFLDSWNWGEFQKRTGEKIWRLGIYDDGHLVAVWLVVRVKARRGTFLFVPHGPNIIPNAKIKNQNDNTKLKIAIFDTLISGLKKLAKEEKASFIRIAPILEESKENRMIYKNLGFRDAPTHMHPEVTWELDITPTEEELFVGMRKTTRYLIRQAQKNSEIEIAQGTSMEDVENFYKIHQETVERQHFTPFSLDYIKKEFESFAPESQISVFFANYRGELIASAIIIFWQGTAFYHHGATSLKYPKIPAAYLLQWEVIREAKRRGCTKYNFWGVARPSLEIGSAASETRNLKHIPHPTFHIPKNHPWYGLTLFKTGFGGYLKAYVKTQDFPLSLRYWPTAIFEFLRRKKRGL